jgi:hypothetical protein
MTDADRDEKFLDCAGRVLGAPGAQRLLAQFQRFETVPNIKSLIKATVPPAGATPQAARGDTARAAK